MKGKFREWAIKLLSGDDIILKSNIGKALLEAKQAEKDRITVIYESDKQALIRQMELEKTLAVEELKAEIIQINSEMSDLMKKVTNAQEVYYKTTTWAKNNAMVVLDMSKQAKKLRETMATISVSIDDIEIRAAEHVRAIQLEEKKDKFKLNLEE